MKQLSTNTYKIQLFHYWQQSHGLFLKLSFPTGKYLYRCVSNSLQSLYKDDQVLQEVMSNLQCSNDRYLGNKYSVALTGSQNSVLNCNTELKWLSEAEVGFIQYGWMTLISNVSSSFLPVGCYCVRNVNLELNYSFKALFSQSLKLMIHFFALTLEEKG